MFKEFQREIICDDIVCVCLDIRDVRRRYLEL